MTFNNSTTNGTFTDWGSVYCNLECVVHVVYMFGSVAMYVYIAHVNLYDLFIRPKTPESEKEREYIYSILYYGVRINESTQTDLPEIDCNFHQVGPFIWSNVACHIWIDQLDHCLVQSIEAINFDRSHNTTTNIAQSNLDLYIYKFKLKNVASCSFVVRLWQSLSSSSFIHTYHSYEPTKASADVAHFDEVPLQPNRWCSHQWQRH